MGRFGRDPREIERDLIVAFWHPEFREMKPIEAFREVRRRRR